jgi:hypothetical protein
LFGAGEILGQQEAASRAAATAIKASFICGRQWFCGDNRHETHASLAVKLATRFIPARQKKEDVGSR